MSRRRRILRAAALASAALLLALGTAYALLPWADLRPASLRDGDPGVREERGRALLRAAARAHGLESFLPRQAVEVVARDDWPGGSPWWPHSPQRFRARRLPGTFTSRVELLDGPGEGEVRGLQSWAPYRIAAGAPEGAEPVFVDPDPAIEFYLPTLQYFDELPFRLLAADVVLDAGEATLGERRFERVFVSWDRPQAHGGHDQYLLFLDPASRRIEKVTYTVRDAAALTGFWLRPLARVYGVGTMHFSDFRKVDGVLHPFRQTVTLGAADTVADPEASYLHRLEVESLAFDTFDPGLLLPDPGLPPPADEKPAASAGG